MVSSIRISYEFSHKFIVLNRNVTCVFNAYRMSLKKAGRWLSNLKINFKKNEPLKFRENLKSTLVRKDIAMQMYVIYKDYMKDKNNNTIWIY